MNDPDKKKERWKLAEKVGVPKEAIEVGKIIYSTLPYDFSVFMNTSKKNDGDSASLKLWHAESGIFIEIHKLE